MFQFSAKALCMVIFAACILNPMPIVLAQYESLCPYQATYDNGACYAINGGDRECKWTSNYSTPMALPSAMVARKLIYIMCMAAYGADTASSSCGPSGYMFPPKLVIGSSNLAEVAAMSGITAEPNVQENVANGHCAVITGDFVDIYNAAPTSNLKLTSAPTCDMSDGTMWYFGCQSPVTCPAGKIVTGQCPYGSPCTYPATCINDVCCKDEVKVCEAKTCTC